jgi:hypothetical protein
MLSLVVIVVASQANTKLQARDFDHLLSKIENRKRVLPPCLHLLVHNIKAPFIRKENEVMPMNQKAKSASEVLTVESHGKKQPACKFIPPNTPKDGQRCKHDNVSDHIICLR